MSMVLKKKKGGRSFAPKIPLQKRPGGPTSAQSSARPSVERQSQTPAPHSHPVQTITIPDDDGPPAPSDERSHTTEHIPPQPILENPKDAPPHKNPPEASSRSLPQNASTSESLKRKTRDQDAAVELANKRHQSSLDEPRQEHPRSILQSSQTNTLPSNSLQPERAITPSLSATSMNVESTPQLPQSANTSSARHPLPDNVPTGRDSGSPEIITNGLGPAGDVGSGVQGGQLAQTPVIVPMAPLNPDGTPGDPVQPATGAKKKVPKRRKVQQGEDGGDVRATVEMQLNRPRRIPGKKSSKKKKDDKKKNKRGETPEGAEDEEINGKEIKMLELTKDLRIGKKFPLHDELRQREKDKIIKAQLAKTHPELAAAMDQPDEAENVEGGAEVEVRDDEVQPEGSGLQMRIVDGIIVVDQNTMQLDRQKQARAAQGEVEAIVENDFSKITTCGTHMKRERAQLWDMAANEIFWKGLRMFGTDFEMISKMFPHRNRRQIKLKFNKEEKDNPAKVDRILKGAGSAIELDTYEELSGVKLEEVEAIEAEREALKAKQQAEEEARLAAHAEAEKKKKEAIHAAVDDGSGEKENQPGPSNTEGEKTSVRSKKARAKKDGNAGKSQRPAMDETVQVLSDDLLRPQ